MKGAVMVQRLVVRLGFASFLLIAAVVSAQDATTGAIVGLVRDSSGGALPGVTVEVTSPALIERSRSVVTDDQGRYRVTALRPGTYAVTFTLQGFSSFKREGITVQTSAASTVNADLAVGAVSETITVSGEAPLVDVTNTAQQTVFKQEVIQALPLGKNAGLFAAVVPGATVAAANIDVAGTKNEQAQNFTVHGGGIIVQLRDGLFVGSPLGGQNQDSSNIPAAIQEVSVQINGGLTAEAHGAGTQVNYIPKDGGNQFRGSFTADYGAGKLQSNNVDAALGTRGATQPAKIKSLYDVTGGIGGPILRDRVWFYGSARKLQNQQYVVGSYFNQTPHTLFYTPDLSQPSFAWTFNKALMTRVTWQATSRDKVTTSYELQSNCNCYNLVNQGQIMADGAGHRLDYPYRIFQLGWNRIATSRLLIDARVAEMGQTVGNQFDRPDPNWIAVFDQQNNRRYGALGGMGISGGNAYGYSYGQSWQGQASVSYVTGAHNFKTGVQLRRMRQYNNAYLNGDVTYTFNGSTPTTAVPQLVTYWATPYIDDAYVQQHALYVQDQWRMKNFTFNPGLRFEYARGYTPEQHLPAGRWVPARDFAPVNNIPHLTDLNPRLGMAWDLFGNGRSALKVALGRYQPVQVIAAGGLVSVNNPTSTMVTSATRVWSDNGDFIPQESELGPLSNANFGKTVPGTVYADSVLDGFGVAPYSWQGGVAFQQEVRPGVAVTIGYFRTVGGNFTVTDNVLVDRSNYDYFCLNAPSDSQLPGGGGQQICGIHDQRVVNPVSNLVRPASDLGKQTSVFNGVDFTTNARFGNGGFVTGGISIGRTVTDNCEVVANLPEAGAGPGQTGTNTCHVQPSWSASTDFKLSASYRFRGDVQVSANYQNSPGIPTLAVWNAPNSVIAPVLGRNLSACRAGLTAAQCTASLGIALVPTNSLYREARFNLLGLAVNRNFRVGQTSIRPRFEIGNALNANTVTTVNPTYGSTWQAVRGVITPRTAKLALQMDF